MPMYITTFPSPFEIYFVAGPCPLTPPHGPSYNHLAMGTCNQMQWDKLLKANVSTVHAEPVQHVWVATKLKMVWLIDCYIRVSKFYHILLENTQWMLSVFLHYLTSADMLIHWWDPALALAVLIKQLYMQEMYKISSCNITHVTNNNLLYTLPVIFWTSGGVSKWLQIECTTHVNLFWLAWNRIIVHQLE